MKRGIRTTRASTHGRGLAPAACARAFTLIELIVVMGAIVLLLAVAVPSFTTLIASQKRSLAQSQLQTGVQVARTLALEQYRGTDTAAVFSFDAGGRLTIIPMVQAGTIPDVDGDPTTYTAGDPVIERDVFVPVPNAAPVALPDGWMVRGLVTDSDVPAGSAWYDNVASGRSSWVFPETGFYDKTVHTAGDDRQTFIVRFEGGTGRIKSDAREALVLLRRWSLDARNGLENEFLDATDPVRFVRSVIADPELMSLDERETEIRAFLMGNASADTALAKPVWSLALYRERDMAEALGVQVSAATGTVYADPDEPTLPGSFSIEEASSWLETGDVSGATAFGAAPSGGIIFALNRADGSLVDLTPDGAGESRN